jgi:hypothetical protein
MAFAHVAVSSDSACDPHGFAFLEPIADLADRARDFERATKGLDALFAKGGQFLPSLRD